jgi:predicted dehydrogenase
MSMADRVRVGVVGTSWFAETLHLASLESHQQAEVSAICGRNRDRADSLAADHNIPHVYTDFREMITSGVLDAVVVVTPDALHYPITMAALEAGLHVMCEKALAMNADQARQMHDTAVASGLVNMVGYTWRCVPPFNYVHHLIEQGYIGRWHHAHFQYQHGSALHPAYKWQLDPDQGHGLLGSLGSHMIDFALWYVGDISRVSGHLTSFVEREGPEGGPFTSANDSALIAVEFAEGAQGTICVSGVTQLAERGQDFQVRLYGDAGSLEIDFNFAGSRLSGVQKGEEEWHDLEVPSEFLGQGDNPAPAAMDVFAPFTNQPVGDRLFIDGITKGAPAEPTFYDGWKAQQVIDATFASHEKGRWITIP